MSLCVDYSRSKGSGQLSIWRRNLFRSKTVKLVVWRLVIELNLHTYSGNEADTLSILSSSSSSFCSKSEERVWWSEA